MIGDVPAGAPLACRLGRHKGQEQGGTMIFQCQKCGGSFWQRDRERLRAAEDHADFLIAAGRTEEALATARDALADRTRRKWGKR